MLNLKSHHISSWLQNEEVVNPTAKYRHRKLTENLNGRASVVPELRAIIEQAHEDARRYLRKCTENNLDPLQDMSSGSIADAYPYQLHLNTKKAYFGEIMAGLVAENFVSSGNGNWRVPAFLFRLHQLAFDQLEIRRESGNTPQPIFGQTGDDCVAFSQNDTGRIVASLVCESKCTNDHDASLITDAHKKFSALPARPVSLSRIIGILRDQENDPEAYQWAEALFELYHRRDLESDYQRFDLVSYTCGQRPVRRNTWIPNDRPHDQYSGGRELESVEIHLDGVNNLVEEVYRR